MATDGPLVSVGLATYNGERFIREALQSLLAQDFKNLEILVSDNASTDRTPSIVAGFVDTDSRVRYVRRSSNVGALANFNSVLAHASGEYFMWAADHDLWDPRYVSSCLAVLAIHPEAVLAYAHTELIDEDGVALGLMDDELGLAHARPIDRYIALIWRLSAANAIYGLIRRNVLVRTRAARVTPSPDHLVLAKLALQGSFIQLAEPLFRRRKNRPGETAEEQRRRQEAELAPSIRGSWRSMPASRYYRGLRDAHIRAVLRAPIAPFDKVKGVVATLACFEYRFGVTSTTLRVARRLAPFVPKAARARFSSALGQPS